MSFAELLTAFICSRIGHRRIILNRNHHCTRCGLMLGGVATSVEDISRAIYRSKQFTRKNALLSFRLLRKRKT